MVDAVKTINSLKLQLAAPPERLSISHHSGPGLRLIFWVQGCRLRCTENCLNPHLLKTDGGYLVESSTLTRTLLQFALDYQEVEGVTVLGGEPFEQAGALVAALTPVKEYGLSMMIYSGHTFGSLQAMNDASVKRLIELCDLLVDGPFINELYDESLVWRGSQNQRILRLSERYTQEDIERAIAQQYRSIALSRGARGDVVVSGTQDLVTSKEVRNLSRVKERYFKY